MNYCRAIAVLLLWFAASALAAKPADWNMELQSAQEALAGGNYALAAGRALLDSSIDAEAIARRALQIAAEICVYTNTNIVVESVESL